MKDYFVNITNNLDIPVLTTEVLPIAIECMDPVDEIIYKYSKHPNIIKINEVVKPTEQFSFYEADEMLIEQEILKLNGKKSVGPDATPPKIIKDSINEVNPQQTKLFNISVEESLPLLILSMPTYHLFLKKKTIPKRKIIGQSAFYPLVQKYSKGLCSNKLLLLYQILTIFVLRSQGI